MLIMCRYEKVDKRAQSASDVEAPLSWGADDVQAWVGVQAAGVNTAQALGEMDAEADLFSQGFDRLVLFQFYVMLGVLIA